MRLPLTLAVLVGSSSLALAAPQVAQKMGDAPHLKPGGVLIVRADCASGKSVSSGGFELTGAAAGVTLVATADHPYSANGQDWTGWLVTILNTSDRNVSAHLNVYAMCE